MENLQLALVHVNEIVVKEERQRQDFKKEPFLELYERISTSGLLHPPGISTLDNKQLVYGERRLRCCIAMFKRGLQVRYNDQLLPLGMIPVNNLNETDLLKLEEFELSENADRQDLTWQEKTRATERIQTILKSRKQREQAEAGTEVSPLDSIKVTASAIATVGKSSISVVADNLVVLEHMDDPLVNKAKSLAEAKKIVAKKLAQEHRVKVAASTDVTQSMHTIKQGDCRELIKEIPANSIRAVITDPPYGIEMHKDQSWDGTWHEYNDDEAYCFNLFHSLIPEWDRVTQDQAHVYAFCDYSKFEKIKAIFDCYRVDEKGKTGFLVSFDAALKHNLGLKPSAVMAKTKPVFDVMYFPFIWNKGNVAAYPRPSHWPRKSYECILYAIKGDHEQARLDLAVIDVPQIQNQIHPAGKPEEVYRHLVERSTMAGDRVLDCFAGQGNLLRAAHKTKRIAVSFELSDVYYPMLVEAYNETK